MCYDLIMQPIPEGWVGPVTYIKLIMCTGITLVAGTIAHPDAKKKSIWSLKETSYVKKSPFRVGLT